jgi:hypothetical protein
MPMLLPMEFISVAFQQFTDPKSFNYYFVNFGHRCLGKPCLLRRIVSIPCLRAQGAKASNANVAANGISISDILPIYRL